jgi:hypothetical protein
MAGRRSPNSSNTWLDPERRATSNSSDARAPVEDYRTWIAPSTITPSRSQPVAHLQHGLCGAERGSEANRVTGTENPCGAKVLPMRPAGKNRYLGNRYKH